MVAGRCERLQIYFATDGIRRARALGTETLGHLDRSKGRDRELRKIEISRIRIVENLAVQCDERLRGIRGTQGDDGYGIRRTAVRSRDGCRRQLFERIGDMVESRFFERLATEENRRNGSARQCQTSIDGDSANRAQLLCVERMDGVRRRVASRHERRRARWMWRQTGRYDRDSIRSPIDLDIEPAEASGLDRCRGRADKHDASVLDRRTVRSMDKPADGTNTQARQ